MSGIFGIWLRDGSGVNLSSVEKAVNCGFDISDNELNGYILINTKDRKIVTCTVGKEPDIDQFRKQHFDFVVGYRQPKITDLGNGLKQPSVNSSKNIWCIYDGEFYDYSDLNISLGDVEDSALIAEAYAKWGIDCLSKLNGLFALMFWNSKQRELLIARDFVGGRPIFFSSQGDHFIFSTHIKAMLESGFIPPKANFWALREFFRSLYPATSNTWFQGVHRLMAGEFVKVKDDKIEVQRYFSPHYSVTSKISDEEYAERIRNALTQAISIRLRSEDDISAHFSGGVDSSSVVCKLSELANRKIKGYTGYFGLPDFDEVNYAKVVAKASRIDHKLVKISFDELPDTLPKVVRILEEPHAIGAYHQYCVYRSTAEDGSKIVFCGEGGDELFGGYRARYLRAGLRDQLFPIPRLFTIFRDGWKLDLDDIRSTIMNLLAPKSKKTNQEEIEKNAPFNSRFTKTIAHECEWFIPPVNPSGFLNKEMARDFSVILPYLMHLEHRLASAFGMYVRSPITDYKMVKLAHSLPVRLRTRGTITKYGFRLACEPFVPHKIIWRSDKMGFTSPFSQVLLISEKLRNYCKELLYGESRPRFLRGSYVRQVLDDHFSRRRNNAYLIWRLIYIATWCQVFNIQDSR